MNLLILAAMTFQISTSNSDQLPDGTRFVSWERPVQFSRTYYVAQRSGADENPGTETQPFRTIHEPRSVQKAISYQFGNSHENDAYQGSLKVQNRRQ